jgi:intracellular sulfur oxidation DsrE/DsrF family protein
MSELRIGDKLLTHRTDLADDLAKLVAKGVPVSVVSEDLAERGLTQADLVPGLELVPRAGVPDLFEKFDQVWHW